jgi:menaquinone-dependent protoporphyrinogen oxidase
VTLTMIDDAEDVAPTDFDLAVVGARIRYGRTDARVIDFARRHAATLEAMPSAYFSVNIVARKAGKDRPETNPYVRAFLRRARWRPRRVEVFAGRLDYPRYGALDRLVIRLIMRMTGGPTRPDTVIEYSDWQRVEAFGRALCADLAACSARAASVGLQMQPSLAFERTCDCVPLELRAHGNVTQRQ